MMARLEPLLVSDRVIVLLCFHYCMNTTPSTFMFSVCVYVCMSVCVCVLTYMILHMWHVYMCMLGCVKDFQYKTEY